MTIVWDIDDVLNDLTRAWLETAWLPEHPDCPVHYQDLRANPPDQALGVSRAEYLDSLDRFRHARYEQLPPQPEAIEWFRLYGGRCRHLALTSAPLACAPLSAAWLMRHYGAWIRTFHVVPSARPGDTSPRYDASKGEFLEWLGKPGVLMVDDSAENLAGARAAGCAAILMPRPWNEAAGSLADAFRRIGART